MGARRTGRWPVLGPPAVFVAVALAYAFPLVFLDHVRSANDIVKVRDPQRALYVRALREGRLALWAPELGAGVPLFAESEIGQLYPLHLLVFSILDARRGDQALEVLLTVLAGLFTHTFARDVGAGRAGALVAGIAFMCTGFFTIHREHNADYPSGIQLPLLLLAAERWARRRRVGTLVWAAAVFGVGLLAGHFQLMFYTGLLFVFFGAWRVLQEGIRGQGSGDRGQIGSSASGYVRALAVVGPPAAILVGFGLAAVQIWPAYEFLAPLRREMPPWFFSSFSAPPYMLANYVSPWLMDESLPNWERLRSSAGETLGYVGIVPLLLSGVAWRARRGVRAVPPLVAGAVLFTLLSFGGHIPGYAVLEHLPGFGHFRAPGRAAFGASCCLAVLAGVGLTELLCVGRRLAQRLAWRLTMTGAVLAGLALVAALGVSWGYGWDAACRAEMVKRWGAWLPFLAGGVAAIQVAARRPRVGAALLVLVSAADLVAFGNLWDRKYGGTTPRRRVETLGPLMQALPPPGSFRVAGAYDLWPVYLGHRTVTSNTFLLAPFFPLGPALERPFEESVRFYRDFGVRYLISRQAVSHPLLRQVYAGPDETVATLSFRPADPIYLYEVLDAPPRARVVNGRDQHIGTCRFLADRPTHIEIETESSEPATLVLADMPFPGWVAAVDGRPAAVAPYVIRPLLRTPEGVQELTYAVSRMVRVPAGRHTVTFDYRPSSLRHGAGISVATAVGLLLAACGLAVRRSKSCGAC
jgi:hypothetical protein